jgi:hypothetical protein
MLHPNKSTPMLALMGPEAVQFRMRIFLPLITIIVKPVPRMEAKELLLIRKE